MVARPAGDVHRQTRTGDGAAELVVLARDNRTLVERATHCLGTLAYDSLAQLYAPDVLLDADVPQWRFQMQGRARVLEALRHDRTRRLWAGEASPPVRRTRAAVPNGVPSLLADERPRRAAERSDNLILCLM